ncbi:hypothetical protein BDQ12DRAFT_674687 [Crucibulum laeve]|uniref:Uncharacterized protein n=1 Tax=Crucibulum laeve TaxID=68775 RepID=A0A5C3MFR8_9AGAR|nr:hypothetical protein BDQ12DRAFT_674687 [Crucibulum laeve]
MSLQRFTRRALLGAATTSPWTTNMRHLLPIPKQWLRRSSPKDPVIKSVRPKDRIKYWNIVPGDQIRLLGDKKNAIHEVLSINRISNRVFVKGGTNAEMEEGKPPPSKNFHYSRCQLFLGNHEFPPKEGTLEPRVIPVFAQRLGTAKTRWNRFGYRWTWERFATKTTPVLPHMRRGEKYRIPWPERIPRRYPAASPYDTPIEVVKKVTYTTPRFPLEYGGKLPVLLTEDQFLATIYNAHVPKPSETVPAELFLVRELSNPHSRAKKMKRWKHRQFQKKTLLKDITTEELKHLNGRSEREAKAEAAFKFRQQMEAEKEAQRKQRWKHRDVQAQALRKNERKERKEQKQRKRLTELVLKDEPNQVLPADLRA